jgi:hypothetical protein
LMASTSISYAKYASDLPEAKPTQERQEASQRRITFLNGKILDCKN